MTAEQKEYIKINFKWPYNGHDILLRYFFLIGPIGVIIISFSMFFGGFKYGHIYKDNFLNTFFLGALTSLAFGVWLTYFSLTRIKRENHFSVLTLNTTISFDSIARKVEPLQWTTLQTNSDSLEFSTKILPLSWGEKITIIKIDERIIIINSRPLNSHQPFTINRDKVNFNKLKTILQ